MYDSLIIAMITTVLYIAHETYRYRPTTATVKSIQYTPGINPTTLSCMGFKECRIVCRRLIDHFKVKCI